jgi:uncharacterized protein YabN with tetrapyrrole methylase and pyrophosphatase domain
MEFKELIQKSVDLAEEFKNREQRDWGVEGNMIELSKQMGQLSQNIMMYEKYYLPQRDKEKFYNKAGKDEIAHRLSDMLFIMIRIADHYKIDLEAAHMKEVDEAWQWFKDNK